MTQTVTHTGYGLRGANETRRVKQHTHSEQKGLKSAYRSQNGPRSAAHNPEVVGSNPAPATINPRCFRIWDFLFTYSLFTIHSFLSDFRTFPRGWICEGLFLFPPLNPYQMGLTQTLTHTGVWSVQGWRVPDSSLPASISTILSAPLFALGV